MSIVRLLVVSIILSSCNQFSDKEKSLLKQSHKLISIFTSERHVENNVVLVRMENLIKSEGNKDKDIIRNLNSKLIEIDEIRPSERAKIEELFRYIKMNEIRLSNSSRIEILNSYKDSTLFNSWKSHIKSDISNHFARMFGAADFICFPHIKPFIEVNSKEIEQGQELKLTFFLGIATSFPKFVGEGILNRSYGSPARVKFLPDQSQKAGVWKGYHINKHDTTVIEIPYEIVDCP